MRTYPICVLSIAALVMSCAPPPTRSIDITAVNYALRAPDSLSAGPALFRLINSGTVPHEVQLFLLKSGISPDSGRTLLAAEKFPDSLADSSGAVLIAAPHTTAPEQVFVDLEPGRLYALVCQFRDSAKAPKHDRLGMFRVLQVK